MDGLNEEQQVHNENDKKFESRVANGWKLMALGSILGFIGCVLTILDIIPEWRDIWMYGLTSVGVSVAFFGCYLVFER
jgi:hypothetical protein